MNIHKNARLTVQGRALLVDRVLVQGLRPEDAAQASGVSVRTAYKWLARYREEGLEGLQDRSSRPHSTPHETSKEVQENIIALRRERQTYRQISQLLGVGTSTISRLLQKAGLNRLSNLEPAPAIVRYEHDQPGDLLHLDIKKLARFHTPGHRVTGSPQKGRSRHVGWDYLHVAIDDHSRLGFGSLHDSEAGKSAVKALLNALRYYRRYGISFKRLLTDNGACYKSRQFRRLCRRLGLKQLFTRPYTPRTNGKAERFIQTALREWAYSRSYQNSEVRSEYLIPWLHMYNWHRAHASLGYLPPVSRIHSVNNLVGLHS